MPAQQPPYAPRPSRRPEDDPVPMYRHEHVDDDDGDDFEYYWSGAGLDIPIPRWIAEILDVPLMVRLEIFLAGVCVGLIFAAIAVIVSFYSAF